MSNKRDQPHSPDRYTLMPKEIMTAVRWGFRALGLAPGYARQAGEMVLYYEIIHGKGVQLLANMLQNFKGEINAADLASKEDFKATIDARNGHSLLSMPAIFEFAYAEAKLSEHPFSVELYNVGPHTQLVEQLVYSTGQRGLTCAWLPKEGIRMVANKDHMCTHLPISLPPSTNTNQAILSVGITTKFKMLDQYNCNSTDLIAQKFAMAEKQGIAVSAKFWNTVDNIAKQILVDTHAGK